MYRRFVFVVLIALMGGGEVAWSKENPRLEQSHPAIREFDVATTARLGRELFREDQLAWQATDVLEAKVGRAKLMAEGAGGWVVEAAGETPTVRFLRGSGDEVEARYDVIFPPGRAPEVVVPEHRALTPRQVAKVRARRTAEAALTTGRHPSCDGNFNYVVLDDPDGHRLLVYFLRAKPAAHLVPVGGHYRITVGEDGRNVEQVDQLFASCLTMDRREVSKPGQLVALSLTHVVSSRPLETHVFLSLQERLPFMVITPERVIWHIENGEMKRTDAPAPPAKGG